MARKSKTVTIKDRRLSRMDHLLIAAKRFGLIAGGVVIGLWLGLWLWLAGGFSLIADRSEKALLAASVQAGFSVSDVLVEGRVNADADVIKALLAVKKGDPIFAVDVGAAQAKMERIPWVKSAQVERRLPGTLYIGLTEREPLALWQHEKKLRLIDAAGSVIAESGLEKFSALPIVTGEKAPARAPEFLALLRAEPELFGRTEGASLIGGRRWDLKLKNGLEVSLPETDTALALRRVAKAQEEDKLLDKDITALDAREPDRLIVRTRPGAVQDYRSGGKQGNAI